MSVLQSETKSILDDLWEKDVQEMSKEEKRRREVSDRGYFRPFSGRSLVPLSNVELVKNGLLGLLVGILIFNENRVSEGELLKTLASFGLNDVESNTSISMTALELILDFVKRDYLQKIITGESRPPDYAMGPRLKAQMSAIDMYRLTRGVFGEKFDLDTQSRVQNSIQRVYKDSEIDFEVENPERVTGSVSHNEEENEIENEL